ncbi:SMI1/KNR4 family protein [Streptomyces pratensis]|uniref:SMI1/KNR4 family protein n=1 Tax=Streptomyces pratensis TaxID=1169025 RepID=UPI003798DEE6
MVESWSRVMNLLEQHAPAQHAELPGPATEQLLAAAEERMGIPLPQDLRAWLLQNNLDLPEEDVDDEVACCGFAGFPDEGSFFLGIRAMESLYSARSRIGGFDPPDRPDNPFWRNEWIPFLSDQDGWTGKSSTHGTGVSAGGSWARSRSRASTNHWLTISIPWQRC